MFELGASPKYCHSEECGRPIKDLPKYHPVDPSLHSGGHLRSVAQTNNQANLKKGEEKLTATAVIPKKLAADR